MSYQKATDIALWKEEDKLTGTWGKERNGWCFSNVRVTVFMLNGCAIFGMTLVAEAPTVWQVNYISYRCYYKLIQIRSKLLFASTQKPFENTNLPFFYIPINFPPLYHRSYNVCQNNGKSCADFWQFNLSNSVLCIIDIWRSSTGMVGLSTRETKGKLV